MSFGSNESEDWFSCIRPNVKTDLCLSYLNRVHQTTQCGPKILGLIFFNRRHMRKTHAFLLIQNKLHWHIYKLLRGRTVSEKLPKIPLFGPSLIHQLRSLGSQKHPQSGALLALILLTWSIGWAPNNASKWQMGFNSAFKELTSFSTWGTENSLTEIKLESMEVIKGCNMFEPKISKHSFVGGRIIVQQKKNSRTERSWTNPMNALQEAIHYSFTKFCIHCFSFWYEFFVHCALRVEKSINMVLMRDLWNFSFFGRGYVSPTHSEIWCFASGSYTKHQVFSSPVNILLKKCLPASAIAIMSWQDATRFSRCSGVKECETKRAYNFLFLQSSFRVRRTTVLGMLKDSAIILDAFRRSFSTKSTTAATFTPVRVDFGRLSLSASSTRSLPSRNQEHRLKTSDRFRVSFP